MITAQTELLADCLDELKPLFPVHHAEIGLVPEVMPLDPDYDKYMMLEQSGELLLVTLRDNGVIAGYWTSFIQPGLHYKSTLTNQMDILYVHPLHRGERGGFMLADAVKAESIRREVKVWFAGSKNHREIEWFLERLGMVAIERRYMMVIGDG